MHTVNILTYMQSPHNAVTPYVVTTCITNIGTLIHPPQEPVCKQESAMAEAVGMDVMHMYSMVASAQN